MEKQMTEDLPKHCPTPGCWRTFDKRCNRARHKSSPDPDTPCTPDKDRPWLDAEGLLREQCEALFPQKVSTPEEQEEIDQSCFEARYRYLCSINEDMSNKRVFAAKCLYPYDLVLDVDSQKKEFERRYSKMLGRQKREEDLQKEFERRFEKLIPILDEMYVSKKGNI